MRARLVGGCLGITFCVGLLVILPGALDAQTRSARPDKKQVTVDPLRFEKAIGAFKSADAIHFPKSDGILFVGSSSIRKWDTEKWFPDHEIIRRGFGGAHLSDVNHFADQIIFPYRPATIVLYAGDNDIAGGKSVEQVYQDFCELERRLRARLPAAQLIYIAIKPSVKRWKRWPKMQRLNERIAENMAQHFNYHVADIVTPMLNSAGTPNLRLFVKDGLHLNHLGYELWTSVLTTELEVVQSGIRVLCPEQVRIGESLPLQVELARPGANWQLKYRLGPEQEWQPLQKSSKPWIWTSPGPSSLAYGNYNLEFLATAPSRVSLKTSHSLKVIEE